MRPGAHSIARRLDATVHLGFLLVLGASVVRYQTWVGATTPPVVFAGVLAALYLAGALIWREPGNARQAWLIVIIAVWSGLTLNTPAFTWCVVPLFFMALRVFPTRVAIPLIILLTVVAGVAEAAHHRQAWDPTPILAPAVIAIMGTVIYRQLQRENARLVKTRDALAASERSSGVLAERVRLSQEIHDTLAQGLSSMHLLLNAADQEWTSAPGRARDHVRQAAGIARDNLAEARRFVRDLTPPALDDSSLPAALSRVCDSIGAQSRVAARFRVDGEPYPLGVDAEIALLRVAQGALANVAQHANASTVVVTLSYLPEAVTLDVADDGVGFDPAIPCPDPDRGFGLRAIRQRVETLGGTTTIESSPGEGTMLAVSLPTQPIPEVDK